MWANPHLFKTDVNGKATCIAGCPPDEFSATGQLWGNPIYDWEAMDKDGYKWWIERLRESFKIYDIVRIDHFRGFESYWEIPAGSDTAAPGEWVKGPGYKLFAAVKEELGELNIIAEDLGFMTDEVIELRERTGFPGMKILQFASTQKTKASIAHTWHLLTQLCTQELTITTRSLVGTVTRLMMRLVSTWLAILTVKNTKQCHTLCFVQSFHQLASWQLQLCKIC